MQNCFIFAPNYQWCPFSYHSKDKECIHWMYCYWSDKSQDCFEHNGNQEISGCFEFWLWFWVDEWMIFYCCPRWQPFQNIVKGSLKLSQLKWYTQMGGRIFVQICLSTAWKSLCPILLVQLGSPWMLTRYFNFLTLYVYFLVYENLNVHSRRDSYWCMRVFSFPCIFSF